MDPASDRPVSAARERLVAALAATAQGDHAAFRELYEATSAKLFGICLRICGERSAAEDVLHDVYVMVWRSAGTYQPARASPITWLATIARNRAIDRLRAQGRFAACPIDAADEVADDAPSAIDALLRADAAATLGACMDLLPQVQHQAIRDAYFGGLTYAELATRDAVALGTMKSRIRRGLIRLRECLDGRS